MTEKRQAEITTLKFPENVRRRRGMYIISKNAAVQEIVDNSIDEFTAGNCTEITVSIDHDEITVIDDGAGIPVTPSKDNPSKSQLEIAMTTLHAGGKFGENKSYQTNTSGMNGLGASCVNALSSMFDVITKTQKDVYSIGFRKGILYKPLIRVYDNNTGKTGTSVRFTLDPEIWGDEHIDYLALKRRLRQLAYLNSGLKITYNVDAEDENGAVDISVDYQFDNGLQEYMNRLTKGKGLITQPLIFETEKNDISVSIAMCYTDGFSSELKSFVNNVNTVYGGDHELGYREAVAKVIKSYASENNLAKAGQIENEDTREGLMTILTLKVKDPVFEGQGKGKLKMSTVRSTVREVTEELLTDYLNRDQKRAKDIVDKALRASKARIAAKKARDTARGLKTTVEKPDKLKDCISKNPEECEIFIVEGDSAGGSCIQGRDPQIQAVLPVFGKILNVEKASLDKLLKSTKMKDIINVLGCGIGEDFDVSKVKYHKIILTSDKDPDGNHIECLHLTFLYRYMRPLIEKGYVYSSNAPLYRITKGKKVSYCSTEEEFKKLDTTGCTVSHIKGLGELTADEMWTTTMNPKTRTLTQITLEDAEAAEETLSVCMGENTQARKEFILSNAE